VGRPLWNVTDGQISKAYRKRSLKVHPDKNPTPEAAIAFDNLNDAKRALEDPIRSGEALRKFAEVAFKEKCRVHPELMAAAKRAQEKAGAYTRSR
jgi:curved DNA-binding protein CbpA